MWPFYTRRPASTSYGKLACILAVSFSVLVVFASQSSVFGQTGQVESEAGAKVKVETGKEKEQTKQQEEKDKQQKENEGKQDDASQKEDSDTTAKAQVKAESSAKASSSSKEQEEKSSKEKGQAKGSGQAKAKVKTGTADVALGVGLKSHYSVSSAGQNKMITLQTNQHLYKAQDTVKVQGQVWSGILDLMSADSSASNIVTVSITDKKGNTIQQKKVEIGSDGKYSTSFEFSGTNQQDISFSKRGAYWASASLDVSSLDGTMLKGQAKKTGKIVAKTNVVVVPAPAVFAVEVKEHGKFDVGVATNSTVRDVQFSGEEKKVSVTVEGESGTRGVTQIDVPKGLVSGEMTVMIDGNAVKDDQAIVAANTKTKTTFEVNYDHSVHTIDVIGSNAVPEFGSLTMLVFAATIIGITAALAMSRSKGILNPALS